MKLSLTCLILVGLAGCQVGRKVFQFDSDSRTPAIGLELQARQQVANPPVENVADTVEVSAKTTSAGREDAASQSRWPRWLPGWEQLRPIPLPRTDLSNGLASNDLNKDGAHLQGEF